MTTANNDRLRGAVARRAEQNAGDVDQQHSNGNGEGAPPTIYALIDRMRPEIQRALPKHMDADRLTRVVVTALRTNPSLLECTPASLLGALMLSAQLGLEPGPLGHCYLVPYWNNKKKQREVQWILGYKGLIDLARRSGQLESIEAREVCENDDFDFEYGLEERLVHKPALRGERGAPWAFYGIARFKDGGRYVLVMSKADVDAHRARSKSAEAGPWVTDYLAMARKTVIRAMAPYLPLNVEAAGAVVNDERVHTGVNAEPQGEAPVIDLGTGEITTGAEAAEAAAADASRTVDGETEPQPDAEATSGEAPAGGEQDSAPADTKDAGAA